MQNRNVGIDIARAVALVGMMIAHLTYLDGVGVQVFYGFPAALFAFISGVSMGYMRARPAQLIVRGLCLIALHFALAPLTGEVFVVLGTIGLCMALLAWGTALEFARTPVVGLRAGLRIGGAGLNHDGADPRLLVLLAAGVGSADDRRDAFPEAHAHASTPRSWPRDWAGAVRRGSRASLVHHAARVFRRRRPHRWLGRHHRKHRGVGGDLLAVLPAAAGDRLARTTGSHAAHDLLHPRAHGGSAGTGVVRLLGQPGRRHPHLLCVARGV